MQITELKLKEVEFVNDNEDQEGQKTLEFFNLKNFDDMKIFVEFTGRFLGVKKGFNANQESIVMAVEPEVALVFKNLLEQCLSPNDEHQDYKTYEIVYNGEIKINLKFGSAGYERVRCNFTPKTVTDIEYTHPIEVTCGVGFYVNHEKKTRGLYVTPKTIRASSQSSANRRKK